MVEQVPVKEVVSQLKGQLHQTISVASMNLLLVKCSKREEAVCPLLDTTTPFSLQVAHGNSYMVNAVIRVLQYNTVSCGHTPIGSQH